MSAITASDVKNLRDRTGAGMMACKNALAEANGDFEKAVESLRARGEAQAAKREGNEANQGTIQSYIHNGMVARYPAAGSQAELFVAVFASPAEAKSAYDKYEAYLSAPNNLALGAKATPLAGIGEKAGSALGVMDDRDFEERVGPALTVKESVGEKGEVGDVVDDGLGDASP